jgi:hypothetical protein
VELAIETRTAPGQWADADDATIATALDVLRLRAEAVKNANAKGKG